MPHRLTIGPWALDAELNTVRRDSRVTRLEPKVIEVLVCLAEHAGEVVRKEDMIRTVWHDTFVTDDVLIHAISELRRVFEDNPKNPRFIETIPKRGYRLIASVREETLDTYQFSRTKQKVNFGESEALRSKEPVGLDIAPRRARDGRKVFLAFATLIVLAGGLVAALFIKPVLFHLSDRTHRPSVKAFTPRYVYATDFTQSAMLAYTVNGTTGALENVTQPFRSGEHPSAAVLTQYRNYLYVANRGRGDGVCGNGCNISAYSVDQISGSLTELDASPFPAGSGPVSLALHPSEKYLYVANVISNDLYVYTRDDKGDLQRIGAPIPVGTHPFFLVVAPSGRFLYVANQDDATISAFSLGEGAELKSVPGSPFTTGLRPRSITIDPTGRFAYVVNYGVNPFSTREDSCIGSYGSGHGRGCNISVFKIDAKNGALSEIQGSPFESDGLNPIAATMDLQGKYLLVANINSDNVSVYQVNGITGAIQLVAGSPFPAGKGPNSIVLDWSDAYLYVVNSFSHNITQFEITAGGQLREIAKPASAGLGPASIVAYHGPTN